MSTEVLPSQLVGEGSAESDLTEQDLQTIVEQALQQILADERVLAIVPDKTRDDNTDVLFPFTADVLRARDVSRFDVLVAQGTHPAMSESQKIAKLGLDNKPFSGHLYDHRWDLPDELVKIGMAFWYSCSSVCNPVTSAVKVNFPFPSESAESGSI